MKRLVVFAAMLILAGAGCSAFGPSPERASEIISNAKKVVEGEDRAFEWKTVRHGVDRGESVKMEDGWKKRLVIYRFDPAIANFGLVRAETAKTIRAWRDEIPDADFMINGVYFQEDGSPAGSLRIGGKEYSKTFFDSGKSGIFEFDGAPSLVDSSEDPEIIHAHLTSAQTYPFLIKKGETAVASDSGMLARRSFIGSDTSGKIYLGAYPDAEISLYALGSELKSLPVEWDAVLNLDGGPSTSYVSMLEGGSEVEDGYSAIPNIIVVRIKE